MTFEWNPIKTIVLDVWNLLNWIKKWVIVDDDIEALTEALEELKRAKARVEEKIRVGEARSDKHGPTKDANDWLNDVGDIEVKVQSVVVDKYNKINNNKILRCLAGGIPANCLLSYEVSNEATKLTTKVRALIETETKIDPVTQLLGLTWEKKPDAISEASSATAQNYLKTACDYIQHGGVGMVGIYGTGGVGKTFLLRSINNRLLAQGATFHHVIWLVASQKLDIHKLQDEIAEYVGFKFDSKSTTVEERGASLCDFFKDKKILLFLDDIWKPIELEKFGVRFFPTNNNNDKCPKVVFTMRSEDVCDRMMAKHVGITRQKIKVDSLDQDEAWDFFLNYVGPTAKSCIDSKEGVREFAKGVAKICGGLPLALKVIASAMSSKKTRTEWEVALDSLKAFDMEGLWDEENNLFPLLKRSYDSLPNETMKKCFLYCSSWAEDAIIKERELILRWLGLNLIANVRNFRSAYNKGVLIIQELKQACLLEEVENSLDPSVKLHDIIRGMALWIASDCGTNKNKWIVQYGEQEGDVRNWGEAEVISLHKSELKNLPVHPSFPKLSALFIENEWVTDEDGDVLFQNMPAALESLSIRFYSIMTIPSSIGFLVGLRSLTLYFIKLEVPIELSNLKELKYLYLGYHVSSIPHGLISKLKKLEFLMAEGYTRWGQYGQASVEELGCSSMSGLTLGIDISTVEMMDQIRAINRQVSLWSMSISELNLVFNLSLLEFIGEERALRANLQTLSIKNCEELTEIAVIGRHCKEEFFPSLQCLFLSYLHDLQTITWGVEVKPGVVFRNVTELRIKNCQNLKDGLTWIGQLHDLERFSLVNCKKLVQVIGAAAASAAEQGIGSGDAVVDDDEIKQEEETSITTPIFSNLKFLELYRLPKLRSFSFSKNGLAFLEVS